MLGFGSAKFNQGTYGKGIMQAHSNVPSTSTVKTFAIAQWESNYSFTSTIATVLMFGGLIKGSTGNIQGTGTMYSHPVFTWAGFGDIGTEQSTVLTSGHIAWDGQLVDDATWTTQTIS